MSKKNSISLKTAKEWAKRWRNKESSYNKHHDCRAFNIPLIDLQEVIKEEGVASVRAYIGVDKKTIEGIVVFEEKLMIVGVDKNGKDMISSEDGETLDAESNDIFDFTKACPSLCDNSSPLNYE
jgi:hypothetical protein